MKNLKLKNLKLKILELLFQFFWDLMYNYNFRFKSLPAIIHYFRVKSSDYSLKLWKN
jgi:hypothetical protein